MANLNLHKLRHVPYECAKCGKKSEEKGIPTLGAGGIKESYEFPFGWSFLRNERICRECVVKYADELEDIEVERLSSQILNHLTDEHAEITIRVMKRAMTHATNQLEKLTSGDSPLDGEDKLRTVSFE